VTKINAMKKAFIFISACLIFVISAKAQPDSTLNARQGTFTDERDGQVYKWVKIGNQIWMAENLNIGRIIYVIDGKITDASIEKLCYKDIEENCTIYGGLYTDNVITHYANQEGARNICPEGWHLPYESEWDILINYLGGPGVAAGAMKEAGTTHWKKTNKGATNSSGFTALPGGICLYDESYFYFTELGQRGVYWSSTWKISLLYTSTDFRTFCLFSNKTRIIKDRSFGMSALSVRCVRDE
jgi:uncharacterized protein (TIGR02145 family)